MLCVLGKSHFFPILHRSLVLHTAVTVLLIVPIFEGDLGSIQHRWLACAVSSFYVCYHQVIFTWSLVLITQIVFACTHHPMSLAFNAVYTISRSCVFQYVTVPEHYYPDCLVNR